MNEPSEIVLASWTWTPQRETAALAVAASKTYIEAAKLAKVSDKSIQRWMDSPEFEARVREHSQRLVRRARQKLESRAEDAADMMIDLMLFGTSRHGVRLAAAKDILDRVGLRPVQEVKQENTGDMTIRVKYVDEPDS